MKRGSFFISLENKIVCRILEHAEVYYINISLMVTWNPIYYH